MADVLDAVPGIQLDPTSTTSDKQIKALTAPKAAPSSTPTPTATPSTAVASSGSTGTATPLTLPATPSVPTSTMPSVSGPVTGDMVVQSGLPNAAVEKDTWAALANWMTKGESARSPAAFTELYNGQQWTGADTNHPAFLGWPGDTGPDGRPTSAYGIFQDEKGTWQSIATKYLGGDTRMNQANQIKGNLMMAADLYQQRTGRNIVADFKAGNTALIEQTLKDQWPSLGGPAAGADQAGYSQYISAEQDYLRSGGEGIKALMAAMNKADPLSDEQHALFARALARSDELSKRFEKMLDNPPQKKSPVEAASSMTPILGLLVSLGGLFTRRPALGAMNAMTGMLTGLKEGNDSKYQTAFDLWKTQTDLAHTAFQMQSETIRSIMDDMRFDADEKQNKLTNAFRFFQMQQDLKLANAGMWKDVWERQQQREQNQSLIQLRQAEAQRAFAQADQAARKERFGGGLTGSAESFYESYVQQYLQDHPDLGGDPSKIPIQDQIDLKNKAITASHTASKPLTAPQEQQNEKIDQAQKYIGTLPQNFDDIVRDPKQYTDDQYKTMGLSPTQIALVRALKKTTTGFDLTNAEKELMKTYDLSKLPKMRADRVLVPGEGGTTDPSLQPGAGADSKPSMAEVQGMFAEGTHSREEIKNLVIQLGWTDEEFDAAFPPDQFPGKSSFRPSATGPAGGTGGGQPDPLGIGLTIPPM